ncbi:MAG: hypothetical protein R3266_06605 [Gemmatimonadota bacterium]|nr:hypothetical protein [Gemmatimonadota bacterium]
MLALGVVAAFAWPLNWDAAWYLEMASQLLDGRRLYVDLIDINPPLIVWISALPVGFAAATGLSGPTSFLYFVLALFGLSFWLSVRVLAAGWPDRSEVRRFLLVLLPAVLLLLPTINFGEREHLLMILAMPYLLVAAARSRPDAHSRPGHSLRRPGRPTTAALGILAGLGFALKPHFLLLPLFVEAWLLARMGPRAWIGRSELATGGAVLAVYAALVLTLTPEYFDAARLALEGYGALDASAGDLLLRGEVYLACGAGLAAWSLWSRPPVRGLGTVLALSSIALVAVAVVQGKGWSYHYYPALCASALLVGLAVLELLRRTLDDGRRRLAYALVGVMVVGSVGALLVPRALDRGEEPIRRLAAVVAREAAGESVMIFSTEIGAAFPLVNYADVAWASRHPALWFLPAFYPARSAARRRAYRSPVEQGETERRLFEEVVEDFVAHEPGLVLVVTEAAEPGFPEGDFDYLEYYEQDPRFERAFEGYERLGTMEPYTLYRRSD